MYDYYELKTTGTILLSNYPTTIMVGLLFSLFDYQIFFFGNDLAGQCRLRLPFRRLFAQADQAAVDNALGNNPHIDLTGMRTQVEKAFLQMVKTGEHGGLL